MNDEPEHISVDTIREIGNLPYVQYYNYSILTFLYSFTFQSYVPTMVGHEVEDWRAGSGMEDWPLDFRMTGVSRAEILYLEQGETEIVEGRTFTEAEMIASNDVETIPIVMSRPHANVNDLSLGSTFTLSDMIPYPNENWQALSWDEDELFAKQDYIFEIVGLFDLPNRRTDLVANDEENEEEYRRQSLELNQMYVPIWAAEAIEQRRAITIFEMNNELEIVPPGWENFDPDNVRIHAESLFLLEDPLDIDAFRERVEPLIPDYYHVRDLSGNFEEISTSMATMLWIADIVLVAAVFATVLILSLTIVLFLRDRRYEMGIYLALGEKKGRIVSQVIFEVVAIALIGITLSLFVGNVASSQISQTMLRNELTRQVEPEPSMGVYGISTYFESLMLTTEMPVDEMMDAFDVTLDIQAVVMFYVLGITTIMISTLIPIMYITQLNPKKILMDGNY